MACGQGGRTSSAACHQQTHAVRERDTKLRLVSSAVSKTFAIQSIDTSARDSIGQI